MHHLEDGDIVEVTYGARTARRTRSTSSIRTCR